MANTELNSIKSEMKTMRIVLKVFTALHIVYFLLSIMSLNSDLMNIIWTILLFIFYLNYILFIWRIPLDKFDKWTETIMACIFGLFAMWIFIQFKDIEKKSSNTTNNNP